MYADKAHQYYPPLENVAGDFSWIFEKPETNQGKNLECMRTGFIRVAAVGAMLSAIATGAACIGPWIAMLLGVGGLGWLAQYAYLRIPAALITLVILVAGFWALYRKPTECVNAKRRNATILLWLATLTAATVFTVEFVLLPLMA